MWRSTGDDAGSKSSLPPPHDRAGGQAVNHVVVIGDLVQVQDVFGDVTIGAEKPQYRIEDYPIGHRKLLMSDARVQPSWLLLPQYAIVPFTGRERQRRDLSAWLADPEPVAVHLIHGAGGQGKTRLAGQLAVDAVAAGWLVWRAMHGSDDAMGHLVMPADADKLLVVVDYADRWPTSHLIALIGRLHALARRVTAVLRVLLLARSAGFWWADIAHQAHRELGIEADEQALRPLGAEVGRTVLFTVARDAFAAAMDFGSAGHIQAPIRLSEEGFTQVLAVHMAALVAVDAHFHGDNIPTDPQAISNYLLQRERAYWHQLHTRAEGRIATTPQTLGRVVYLATLAGALPRHDAQTALRQAGVASMMETANQVIDDHRTCYPPTQSDEVLEPLHPDRLGEDFIALLTPGYAGDATACDDWAATAPNQLLTGVQDNGVLLLPSYSSQALTVLTEVARRWPHVAQRQLYPLLREQPWLALAAGSGVMARLAELTDVDIGVLEAIEKANEQFFPNIRYIRLDSGIAAIAQRLTDHRLATIVDPPRRGQLYMMLAKRLTNAGRWKQALTACTEALDLYRPLSAADPITFEPDLAQALISAGVVLGALGRRSDALAATTEGVEIYHRLVAAESAEHLSGLAWALGDLGIRLSELGRRNEALDAAIEAVNIRRRLAEGKDGIEPELAVSLISLGGLLYDVGRTEEGLSSSREAVDIFRQLEQAGSAVHDIERAIALNNLGTGLMHLERWGEALTVMSDTVQLRRELAGSNPAILEPYLGGSLINLGSVLAELRRWEEALTVATEATEIYHRLAIASPARFSPELAKSLTALGHRLSRLERWDEALPVTAEAIEIYHRLARENPGAFEPELAIALTQHSAELSTLGRRHEARQATMEAIEIYHGLARENPATFEPELAMALFDLCDAWLAEGRQKGVLVSLILGDEVVRISRRLTQEEPGAFAPKRVRALVALGLQLFRLGRQEEALASANKAVEITRRLAQKNPASFRHDLASALLASAWLRAGSNVDLPQALDAAKQSAAIYKSLAASDPAAFADDLIRAQSAITTILDCGRKNEEAVRIGRPTLTVPRVLVAEDIREELDEASLAQVEESLYPVDCQTCGQPLGSAPPVLHVDGFDSWAAVGLHHSRCKRSEWNRAVDGVMIVNQIFEAYLSWISRSLLVPVTDADGVVHPLPMLVVNPGLEQVFLKRNPLGQWRVQIQEQYYIAGLKPTLQLGEPIAGASASISGDDVSVTMRITPPRTYDVPLPDQRFGAKIREAGGIIFAVTHAVNPHTITTIRELEAVFIGDRSLSGWVGLAVEQL